MSALISLDAVVGEGDTVADGLEEITVAVVDRDRVAVHHVLGKEQTFARCHDRLGGNVAPDLFDQFQTTFG